MTNILSNVIVSTLYLLLLCAAIWRNTTSDSVVIFGGLSVYVASFVVWVVVGAMSRKRERPTAEKREGQLPLTSD